MKNKFQKTLLAFAFLLVANCLIAQVPQGIPYQAVARDNAGNLIKNQNIALRFKIHDGTATGTVVFTETHSVTTDALGLFSVNIGGGTSSGPLADVNWGSGAKFTQVELDVSGSSNYIDMGTTQMMSVPYALYAAKVTNSFQMPAGVIFPYGGINVPAGYLKCDGSEVSRTQYADLFAAIATNYGVGNGSTTFNLPDFRGRFLRGVDDGTGVDPDAASRFSANGGNTGDNVGSQQWDENKAHYHKIFINEEKISYKRDSFSWYFYDSWIESNSPYYESTDWSGGNESRPRNVSVNYLIKH
jgi:hypothetical protein